MSLTSFLCFEFIVVALCSHNMLSTAEYAYNCQAVYVVSMSIIGVAQQQSLCVSPQFTDINLLGVTGTGILEGQFTFEGCHAC